MLQFIALSGAALGVVGAILGARAATITVRNSQDHFIEDLHRQGRWASYAATAAAVTATLGALEKLLG